MEVPDTYMFYFLGKDNKKQFDNINKQIENLKEKLINIHTFDILNEPLENNTDNNTFIVFADIEHRTDSALWNTDITFYGQNIQIIFKNMSNNILKTDFDDRITMWADGINNPEKMQLKIIVPPKTKINVKVNDTDVPLINGIVFTI